MRTEREIQINLQNLKERRKEVLAFPINSNMFSEQIYDKQYGTILVELNAKISELEWVLNSFERN